MNPGKFLNSFKVLKVDFFYFLTLKHVKHNRSRKRGRARGMAVRTSHLLKRMMAMTMLTMSTTARTGPITHNISGDSTVRGKMPLSTITGSEYGLDENTRCRNTRRKETKNNLHSENNQRVMLHVNGWQHAGGGASACLFVSKEITR